MCIKFCTLSLIVLYYYHFNHKLGFKILLVIFCITELVCYLHVLALYTNRGTRLFSYLLQVRVSFFKRCHRVIPIHLMNYM